MMAESEQNRAAHDVNVITREQEESDGKSSARKAAVPPREARNAARCHGLLDPSLRSESMWSLKIPA